MQAISDKIRHYRKTFRSLYVYALGTRVVWLSVALMGLILGLIFLSVYLRMSTGIEFLSGWHQVCLLASEMLLLPGIVQAYFMGAERRQRQFYPQSSKASFRIPYVHFDREKLAYLQTTFSHQGDLRVLVKRLVEEWEWRQELKVRAQEPVWRKAMVFFRLPSATNFAAYMTGLVAVIAGIVIATLNPEVLFGSFDQFVKDAWALIYMMWANLIPLIVFCILPGAIIISAIKYVAELLLEWLDDQYLSQAGFYRFISELLELHDGGQRKLMRKTRGRVYWSVRLGMAPLGDIPNIWKKIKRAKRLAKRKLL